LITSVAVEFDQSFTDHGLSLAYDTYGSSDASLVVYLHTGMYSSQCGSGAFARLPPSDPDSSGTERWCHACLNPRPGPAFGQTSLVAAPEKTLLQTLGPQRCER
jgi:hypothetical protein